MGRHLFCSFIIWAPPHAGKNVEEGAGIFSWPSKEKQEFWEYGMQWDLKAESKNSERGRMIQKLSLA